MDNAQKWLAPLGVLLVMGSIVGLAWIYIPVAYYQVKYSIRQSWFKLLNRTNQWRANYDSPNWTAKYEYEVFVPQIDARAPVVPQVNANSEKEYFAALKRGVAEVAGLSVPGRRGTTYLFAHSTDNPLNFSRYNAVFYLLDKMEPKDQVEIYYKGNYYHYLVEKKDILEANDTRYLVPQFQQEILILQTCYPPGTIKKRLIVVAKRIT